MKFPENDRLEQNEQQDLLSRRKFIASLGIAGLTMAAAGTIPLFPKAAEAGGVNDIFNAADYASIGAAVSAAEAAGGGTVYIPPGTYTVNATINVTRPIYIVGAGTGTDTSNPNGTGNGITTLKWTGAAGAAMFHFKSATANNYLFGGGLERCVISGENVLGTAIRASSVGMMRFSTIVIWSVTDQGMLLDAANGVLTQFNIIDNYDFVYGVTAAVQNAHGIVLRGNSSAGVTQNHIQNVRGLVHTGSVLRIEWSDNNVVEKLFGYSLGSGKTLYLATGVGGNATYNFIQYMAGNIHAEAGTAGNRIVHLISEGGGLSADTGAQIHYEVADYARAALYSTHTYKMSDTIEIATGAVSIMSGGAAQGVAALQWPCINLPDGQSSKIGFVVPSVRTWDFGTLTTLTVKFSTDYASTAGKKFRIRVKASTYGVGGGIATPAKDVTALIAAPTASYAYNAHDIALDLLFQLNEGVFISVEREGAHSDDTALNDLKLLGFEINYIAAGPYSPGSGTYAVTPPYI